MVGNPAARRKKAAQRLLSATSPYYFERDDAGKHNVQSATPKLAVLSGKLL
jgi:hypothetical protein